MRKSSILYPLIAILLWLGVGPAGLAAESELQWEAVADHSLALNGPHGIVWRFNYAAEQSLPYFDPVSVVSGESLTWNEPPDHVWHHAFWFSWKFINGINYWEHDGATGRPAGRTLWKPPVISTTEDGMAKIEIQLSYAPRGTDPVLHENRSITVFPPDDDGRYHFDWDATFHPADGQVVLDRTPIPPHPDGKPWGGYAGLSLRLSKNLADRRVVTQSGEADFGQSEICRSRGIARSYEGKLNGKPVGIAVLSHPQNPRDPTPWYAIRSQMSYLNPAFLQDEPYTIQAGKSLRLRYRVVVHSGHWDATDLSAAAAAYRQSP